MIDKSTKKILNSVIGLGLFAWLSYSIYHQVRNQENLQLSVRRLQDVFHGEGLWSILAVTGLMLVNWGIEARKWQLLVTPLEKISFRKAFYAILSGVSLSINTPNRIGEYGGRILYLRQSSRLRAIAVTLVGSISQFIVTVVMGIAGLIFYIVHFEPALSPTAPMPHVWQKVILFAVVLIAAVGLLVYFRLGIVVTLFQRIRWLRRLRIYALVVTRFSGGLLVQVLLLSALRYLVFSAQYLILLDGVGVQMIWWQGLLIIFFIYLVMSLIPTIAIAELGVRGQVSLFFLGLLSINKIGIIVATLGIWLINLVIPAVAGSLLLLGIKMLNKDKQPAPTN